MLSLSWIKSFIINLKNIHNVDNFNFLRCYRLEQKNMLRPERQQRGRWYWWGRGSGNCGRFPGSLRRDVKGRWRAVSVRWSRDYCWDKLGRDKIQWRLMYVHSCQCWKFHPLLLSPQEIVAQLWTGTHQAPLSMGFSRQEYWSGLPFSSPGDLPDSGIKPRSPALQADSLLTELRGKPSLTIRLCLMVMVVKMALMMVMTWWQEWS